MHRPCAGDVRSRENRNGISHIIFAAPTKNAVITPEKDPTSSDDLERLEQLHQKMKEETEAWQNLLENLRKMRNKQNEKPETRSKPE